MSIADFNFEIFGKKNGPDRQFYQWLYLGLQDVHRDVGEVKEGQAKLNAKLETHMGVQEEQWKRGCPMSIGAMIIAIGSFLYSWVRRS